MRLETDMHQGYLVSHTDWDRQSLEGVLQVKRESLFIYWLEWNRHRLGSHFGKSLGQPIKALLCWFTYLFFILRNRLTLRFCSHFYTFLLASSFRDSHNARARCQPF